MKYLLILILIFSTLIVSCNNEKNIWGVYQQEFEGRVIEKDLILIDSAKEEYWKMIVVENAYGYRQVYNLPIFIFGDIEINDRIKIIHNQKNELKEVYCYGKVK